MAARSTSRKGPEAREIDLKAEDAILQKGIDKLTRPQLIKGLCFDKQMAFLLDATKRKAGICSRRAGKTTGIAVDLMGTAREPMEGDCAYIGLTRRAAKQILFPTIAKMNRVYRLGFEPNIADLCFRHSKTGNTIYLTGANNQDEAEKLRGLKLRKVVLDEVASFRSHVNYLVEEILEPTLIDTDGDMILIGTPSANPGENFFHKITTHQEQGWAVHKWTILDNPYIPHAAKWLEDYRTRKQWAKDHPIYLREWQGEWTYDVDSMVYKYRESTQDFTHLPPGEWHHIVGIDLGFDDAFTICVIAFSYTIPECYVVHQVKKSGLIPSKMKDEIEMVKARFSPIKMVGDHGGLGKAIIQEFNQRHLLNIAPAEKTQKFAYIELVNGDLISGLVKIKKDSELAKEMVVHQWDPDKRLKEDDRTQNDLCDAFLYAWRESKHYRQEPKLDVPEVGSDAYNQKLEAEILEHELENFEKEQNLEWWNKL